MGFTIFIKRERETARERERMFNISIEQIY